MSESWGQPNRMKYTTTSTERFRRRLRKWVKINWPKPGQKGYGNYCKAVWERYNALRFWL